MVMVLNNNYTFYCNVFLCLTYSLGLKSVNNTQRKGAAAVNDSGNDDK